MRGAIVWVLAAGCTATAPYEGTLLFNGSFEAWCGDVPCSWEQEGGRVIRRPTWDPGDQGVELQDGAVLTQHRTIEPAWLGQVWCVRASVLVDGQSDITLEVDLQNDGRVELVAPLQPGGWQLQTFTARTPIWFDEMRVSLRHGGAETSHTVASVEAMDPHDGGACADAAALQPLGMACGEPGQCESSYCHRRRDTPEYWSDDRTKGWIPQVCGGCEADADCGSDEVCGAVWGEGPFFHRDCVPAGVAALGEVCGADDQCDTGVCCNARCSDCCDAMVPCNGTGRCEARALRGESSTKVIAAVCDVGARAIGSVCSFDEDCPTACVGPPLQACATDGRTCGSDLDCVDGTPGSCLTVGVRNGTCE